MLVVTLATACSPAQRQAAGLGVVTAGLTTSTTGVYLVDPCLFGHDDPQPRPDPCRAGGPGHESLAPEAGGTLFFIGLSAMVLGGILYGTGLTGPSNQSQHGAAAAPSKTNEPWPTPARADPDF